MEQIVTVTTSFLSGMAIGMMTGFILGSAVIKHKLDDGKVNLSRLFTYILVPAWLIVLTLQFAFGVNVPNIVHVIFGIPIGDLFGVKITELWGK